MRHVAGANVMPILFSGSCVQHTGRGLEMFDSGLTTLTAYGCVIIKQFGVRVMKVIWKNKKWKFIFQIVDAQGQVLLGLRTLKQMDIFTNHLMVYKEMINLCSSQLKEEKNGQTQMRHQEADPEMPRVGDTQQTPAGVSQIQTQANTFVAYSNNDLVLDAEYDVEDWWNQIGPFVT